MRDNLILVRPFALFLLLVSLLTLNFSQVKLVFSAADHVIINEIQIAGAEDADDEFVELYNPTDSAVDLTGWQIRKKTGTAEATDTALLANLSGSIQPHQYLLIAHTDYDGAVAEDLTYMTNSMTSKVFKE